MIIKYRGTLKLLFLLLFSIVFVFLSTTCLANDENKPNTSLEDTWLSADSMLKILEGLKVETANSGELCFLEYYTGFPKVIVDGEYPYIWTYTANKFSTIFNNWFHTYYYNYDVVIDDLMFYWPVYSNTSSGFGASNTITIFINNTSSPFVGNFIPNAEFYSNEVSYTGGYKTFYRFSSFSYDGNNNKTGINNQQPNNNCFVLSENNVTVNNYGNTPNVYMRYLIDNFYVNTDGSIYSTLMAYLTFNNETEYNHLISYKWYYKIPTSTSIQNSYNMGRLNRYINLGSGETPTPTPTGTGVPGPTGTGSPSGGGDLSNIENTTEHISNTLDDAFNSDTSTIDSGDINFNTEDYEMNDITENFFTWLLSQVQNILTTNEVVTYSIDLYDNTYSIRSDFLVFLILLYALF